MKRILATLLGLLVLCGCEIAPVIEPVLGVYQGHTSENETCHLLIQTQSLMVEVIFKILPENAPARFYSRQFPASDSLAKYEIRESSKSRVRRLIIDEIVEVDFNPHNQWPIRIMDLEENISCNDLRFAGRPRSPSDPSLLSFHNH